MKLYYEESSDKMPQAHPNGLISGYDLKYAGVSGLESNHHRYDFTYDQVGRLQEANYFQWEMYTDPYGEVGWHWQGSDKYKVFNLSYDANGNILSLSRNNVWVR
jgi:hypothetical protein